MISTRKKIRINYAPLDIAVSVQCTALSQVKDTVSGEYSPDHSFTPLVLRPSVMVSAPDGSWPLEESNARLTDVTWRTPDGIDYDERLQEVGANKECELTKSGPDAGTLTITKNFGVGEVLSLYFTASLVDTRQSGKQVTVVSDVVTMTCVARSEDEYVLNVGCSQNFVYDPLNDPLAAYEFRVAKGQEVLNPTTHALLAQNDSSYKLNIPVVLYRGTNIVPINDYSVSIARTDTDNQADMSEIEVVDKSGSRYVSVDLRLVNNASYRISVSASVGGVQREMAGRTISFSRASHIYDLRQINDVPILSVDTHRSDSVVVSNKGVDVENPERLLDIAWYVSVPYMATNLTTYVNRGASTYFKLADVGFNSKTSYIEVYVEAEPRGVFSVATDNSGNSLTDENGNELIFN